jgi:hypothetical protein
MAGYNEILVGRFNRGLQKLFGMKGGPPVPTLSSEIMPVHWLHNAVDSLYLEGWSSFGISVSNGAVAAQNTAVQIRNPVAVNMIAVIFKLKFQVSAADSVLVRLGSSAADLTTLNPAPNSRLDSRTNSAPSAIISRANNAIAFAGGNNIDAPNVPVSSSYEEILTEDQQIPLLPGDALEILTVGVNETLIVTFWWRERFLEDSERT